MDLLLLFTCRRILRILGIAFTSQEKRQLVYRWNEEKLRCAEKGLGGRGGRRAGASGANSGSSGSGSPRPRAPQPAADTSAPNDRDTHQPRPRENCSDRSLRQLASSRPGLVPRPPLLWCSSRLCWPHQPGWPATAAPARGSRFDTRDRNLLVVFAFLRSHGEVNIVNFHS